MSDMGDIYRDTRERDKKWRESNLARANDEGWTKHTDWHWSRCLCGYKLDYWPSRNRFRWRGKTRVGDVLGFIRNVEAKDGP